MSQEINDTINIELVVTAVQIDEKVWMQGDIEILINGRKPYNEGDIIDTEILLASLANDGEFFIFSCCCGVPQCSEWTKGIKVVHQLGKIIWIDDNNERKWTLDKVKMKNDIKAVKEEAISFKKYFLKKGIDYVGVGYNW